MKPRPITVAVLEDDAIMRAALVEAVQGSAGLQCVGDWGTADAMREALRRHQSGGVPEVLLLDLDYLGVSGIRVIPEIRRFGYGLRVLTYSPPTRDDLVLEALRCGADGHAVLRRSFSLVLEGIRAVCRGDEFYPPSVAREVTRSLRAPRSGGATGWGAGPAVPEDEARCRFRAADFGGS